MLEQYQQYWPVLVVFLLAIVAGLFLARRGKHVAIDSEPSIRPTLSRERAAVPLPTDVTPEAKLEIRIEPVVGTPDNLTAIKGLGPRIQTMLNGFGITRFEQIARLTPEEQINLDQNMGPFKGRMEQDRWVEQAAILASGDRGAFESEFGKISGG